MPSQLQGTAKIYDFPPRGRFALNASHDSSTAKFATPTPAIMFDSWYHDEAIEAERSRKN